MRFFETPCMLWQKSGNAEKWQTEFVRKCVTYNSMAEMWDCGEVAAERWPSIKNKKVIDIRNLMGRNSCIWNIHKSVLLKMYWNFEFSPFDIDIRMHNAYIGYFIYRRKNFSFHLHIPENIQTFLLDCKFLALFSG